MKPFIGNIGDVIIVKNETSDGNLEMLRQLYPNTRIIRESDKDTALDFIIKKIDETPESILISKTKEIHEELKGIVYEDDIFEILSTNCIVVDKKTGDKIFKEINETPEVVVTVNEELTDEEREVFMELYPRAKIIVKK